MPLRTRAPSANNLATFYAIRDGVIPNGPTVARGSAGTARSFRKQHQQVLTDAAKAHLSQVILKLDEAASNQQAQDDEQEVLETKAEELEDALLLQGGVYVYTYPQYWKHPTAEGTKRTALKVGMTTRDAKTRIRQQARVTAGRRTH